MTRLDEFMDACGRAVDGGDAVSLVLSRPKPPVGDLRSIRIRAIELRGERTLSFVSHHATRDVTTNRRPAEGLAVIAAHLDPSGEAAFEDATLHAGDVELQWRISRHGRQALVRKARSARPEPASGGHDRPKVRALSLDLPFWTDLGITDDGHRLVPAMARKWKQIDKFLDVLDPALDRLQVGEAPLRVVDYGCGKGYLTFAVHEHLRRRFGGAPEVTGVELRADLVERANRIAERAGCSGLTFVHGDLRSVEPQAVDVMIALHACDTATDYALDLGLRAGAQILVASPCCHKELRLQMAAPQALAPLLRHGVHLGQEAEMLTDGLRALLLEAAGYEAKVFEFVSLEHTSKNKMILATHRSGVERGLAGRALADADALKSFYGIREQALERLLRQRLALPPAGAAAA